MIDLIIKMNLTPKIKYQKFLYNYFSQYIKQNLYNDYYNVNKKDICIQEINILSNQINELQEINSNEFIRYKKSRGKHRKHLTFLTYIRRAVLYNKEQKLSEYNKIITCIPENEKKFNYRDYDDYFCKHINYYKFVQKIKYELKKKYDTRIEDIYKNVYKPTMVVQVLEKNTEIEDVFIFLNKKIENIMYNVF